MPPAIAAPYPPRLNNRTDDRTDAAIKEHNKTKAIKEDEAIQALSQLVDEELKRLSEELGHSEQTLRARLFMETRPLRTARKVNGFNAVVHAVAKEMNRDLPIGARCSLVDITHKVHKEGIYEKMAEDELQRLMQQLEYQRASKTQGKRITPHQKVSDISCTLGNVHQQLASLYQRSGVRSLLISVRSDATFKFDPSIWTTDEIGHRFIHEYLKISPVQLGTYMEAWSLTGGKDTVDNNKKRVYKLKQSIRALVNQGLATITGDPNAMMTYTEQYDDRIVMKYGVHLIGWPLEKLTNPSNIHSINDLFIVEKALANGVCRWVRLTDEEFEQYADNLEQEVSLRQRKPLNYAPGAIKGCKRKATGSRMAPPKRTKTLSSDNGTGTLETLLEFQ